MLGRLFPSVSHHLTFFIKQFLPLPGALYGHGTHRITASPLSFTASSLSILFSAPAQVPPWPYSESCHHLEPFCSKTTDLSISLPSNWSLLHPTCFINFFHYHTCKISVLSHCISPLLPSPLSLFSLDSRSIISTQPTIPKFFHSSSVCSYPYVITTATDEFAFSTSIFGHRCAAGANDSRAFAAVSFGISPLPSSLDILLSPIFLPLSAAFVREFQPP